MEIFRVNYEGYTYIAYSDKITDETVPKSLIDSGITPLWITLCLTNRSAFKNRGKNNKGSYRTDNRFLSVRTEDGFIILKKLISEFENWMQKTKPKALVINAYNDKYEKRLRLYNKILSRNGYALISYDLSNPYYNREYNYLYYARKDLGLKEVNFPVLEYDIRGTA